MAAEESDESRVFDGCIGEDLIVGARRYKGSISPDKIWTETHECPCGAGN